ncbi:MAG TPA: hypothetical protein VHY80_05030, partial [Stellaceae bacterium]|nr:hypothetical protein [Stellaceae bacterium]
AAGDENGFVVELAHRSADMLGEVLNPASFTGGRLGRRRRGQQRFGGAQTSGNFGALGHGFSGDFREIVD